MGPAGKWFVSMCSSSSRRCTSIRLSNMFDPLTAFDDLNAREARMQSLRDSTDSYRLIVTRRNASEILLSQDGSGWTLPRVAIRPRQRLAEQLVSGVNEKWGLETYCLFVPNPTSSVRTGDGTK